MVTRAMELAPTPTSKMETATDSEKSPKPKEIGREFVRQYYTMLSEQPGVVHRFYSNESIFMHGKMDEPVKGQTNIQLAIEQLDFVDCHAKIHRVDCSETLQKGLVIQVAGELSNHGEPSRKFLQTIILCPQGQKKYYVHNDIFAYVDDVFSDEPVDQSQPPAQPSAPRDTAESHAYQPRGSSMESSGNYPNGNAHPDDLIKFQDNGPTTQPSAPVLQNTTGTPFPPMVSAPLPPRGAGDGLAQSDSVGNLPPDPAHTTTVHHSAPPPLTVAPPIQQAPPAEPTPHQPPSPVAVVEPAEQVVKTWAQMAMDKNKPPTAASDQHATVAPPQMISPNQRYDVEAPAPSQPTAAPSTQENIQSPMGVSGRGNVQPIVLNGDKDVFIGGLPLPSVTDLHQFQKIEQELGAFLENHHGRVQSVRCPVRREAQKAAFAFVSFETNEGAESFIRSIMPNTKNNVELDLNYTGVPGPVIAYVDKIKSPVQPGMGGRFGMQGMGRSGPDRPRSDMGGPRGGGGGYQTGNKPGGGQGIGPRGMQRTGRGGGGMQGGRGGGRGMPSH